MNEVVTILFPSDPGAEELEALRADLRSVEGFTGAGTETTRSVGLVELALWVGFAADALAVATVAVATLAMVIDKVRGRRIRGAVIELPNGAKISVDSTSPEELRSIVSAWQLEKAEWSAGGTLGS